MNRRTLLRRVGTASVVTGAAAATAGVTAADAERIEVESVAELEPGAVDHHRIVVVGEEEYLVGAGIDPAGKEFHDQPSSQACCAGVTGCDVTCDECKICYAL